MNQQLMETTEEVVTIETKKQASRVIEGVLFSSSEPVSLRKLTNVLSSLHPFSSSEVKELIDELKQEYDEQNRAFQIEEIGRGYIMRTCETFSPYIQQLLKQTRPDRLSHAALEVLAIIAYRQPITRPQIDEIRGVDSSGIIHTLIERQLIESAGKLEVPGRPTLYTVSNHFLQHFGLKDRKDLPKFAYEPPKEEIQEVVVEEEALEVVAEEK